MKCSRLSIRGAPRYPELIQPERARSRDSCLCQLRMEHCCTWQARSPEDSRGQEDPWAKRYRGSWVCGASRRPQVQVPAVNDSEVGVTHL